MAAATDETAPSCEDGTAIAIEDFSFEVNEEDQDEDDATMEQTINELHQTRMKQTPDLPIELQCEKVDMDNEQMDMLEWLVRKAIPIPKAYYWETGNDNLPVKVKAWHRIVGMLGTVVRFVDRLGQPVVNATGLRNSRFDFVTSTMTEEEWERSRKAAADMKLRNECRRSAIRTEEGGVTITQSNA